MKNRKFLELWFCCLTAYLIMSVLFCPEVSAQTTRTSEKAVIEENIRRGQGRGRSVQKIDLTDMLSVCAAG
jgi:hypothetical protein